MWCESLDSFESEEDDDEEDSESDDEEDFESSDSECVFSLSVDLVLWVYESENADDKDLSIIAKR